MSNVFAPPAAIYSIIRKRVVVPLRVHAQDMNLWLGAEPM